MTDTLNENTAEFPAVEEVDAPQLRTLLDTWQQLLASMDIVQAQHLGPADASRILRDWPQLKVQELGYYVEDFFDRMHKIRDILVMEIELDPECLKKVDDDGVENAHHYLNLLLQWQLLIQRWSEEWDHSDEHAHITLATIAETQKFLFGREGMCNHLDQIEFEFSEEDANMIQDELLAAREA